MTKSYIKEAEQNVISQAKFWHEFLEFARSMESGINNATDRWSPSVPDVDALAQFIREIDGDNKLGAGALAERIVEWLAAAPEAKP